MADFVYSLCTTADPEERLEDAAMWKALHDVHGDNIRALGPEEPPVPGTVFFGRGTRKQAMLGEIAGVGLNELNYWQMPAFLNNAGREFHTIKDWSEAEARVREIFTRNGSVFLKSTRAKHMAVHLKDPEEFEDELGGWAFSFIDGGPAVMVQETVDMGYEQRFLFLEGDLITSSPVAAHITPMSELPESAQFRTPGSREPEVVPDRDLTEFACKVAAEAQLDAVCIDCAWDMATDRPIVVEFNPFHVGQVGLYKCDPVKIAEATTRPIFRKFPVPGEKPAEEDEPVDRFAAAEARAKAILGALDGNGDDVEFDDNMFDDDAPVPGGP